MAPPETHLENHFVTLKPLPLNDTDRIEIKLDQYYRYIIHYIICCAIYYKRSQIVGFAARSATRAWI